MSKTTLKAQLEALLFISTKPLAVKELVSYTQEKPQAIETALKELADDYQQADRGLSLIKTGQRYQLTSGADQSELLKKFLQDESSGELSQPSLEALTIIAYRGPIAKPELDVIRGVNCSLIVRNLLLRGLIEEKFNKDKQEYYYAVSHDFIRWLGLRSIEELPEYEKLNNLELHALSPEEGELVG